jgi:hypothetical protein
MNCERVLSVRIVQEGKESKKMIIGGVLVEDPCGEPAKGARTHGVLLSRGPRELAHPHGGVIEAERHGVQPNVLGINGRRRVGGSQVGTGENTTELGGRCGAAHLEHTDGKIKKA